MSWLSHLNLSNLVSSVMGYFGGTAKVAPAAELVTALPDVIETIAPATRGWSRTGLAVGVGIGIAGYVAYKAIQSYFAQSDEVSGKSFELSDEYERNGLNRHLYPPYYPAPIHYQPKTVYQPEVYPQITPAVSSSQPVVYLPSRIFPRSETYTPTRRLFESREIARVQPESYVAPTAPSPVVPDAAPAPIVFPEFRSPEVEALPMPAFNEPTVFPDWMEWEHTVESVIEDHPEPMEVDEPVFRFR